MRTIPGILATLSRKSRSMLILFAAPICLCIAGCWLIKAPYHVVSGTVKGSYYIVKGAYELTAGTTKLVYKVGTYTFRITKAPLDWAFVRSDIDSIDGLPPKEAIR